MSGVSSAVPSVRQAKGSDFEGLVLQQIPLGGGGFVTGIDASADGSRFVCRTDVANAYVRNRQDRTWRPLFSPASMLAADRDPLPQTNNKSDGLGVAGIRIAPSNRDIIYAAFLGYVWRSDDGGMTVRRTGSPQLAMFANRGDQRLANRLIDVAPADPAKVMVGTHGEGMWYSVDGGGNWQKSSLPVTGTSLDNEPGIHLVLFDWSVADRVWVFVTGVGLLRSDSGPGGQFRVVEDRPKNASGLLQGCDNTVYVTENVGQDKGAVWRIGSDGSSRPLNSPRQIRALAIDPRDPLRLVATDPYGSLVLSTDGGDNWTGAGSIIWTRSGGEVGWTRDLNSIFPAEVMFDPAEASRLLIAQGVGVAAGDADTLPLQVSDWSAGIEELCAVDTLAVPGGGLLLSALDKSFWRVDHADAYANSFRFPTQAGGQANLDIVAAASFMDFAGDDPDFLVGVVAAGPETGPGFSEDRGKSWKVFPAAPPMGWGSGGCIAASTRRNIVLLPANNGVGAYTLDGGSNWSSISLDGGKPTSSFNNAFYVRRKNISADKTRTGTFALVYPAIEDSGAPQSIGGIWVTRDGGRTWTQRLKGVVSEGPADLVAMASRGQDIRQYWQCELAYVPGRSGELLYTPHADAQDDRLYWSSDDGATWREVHSQVRNVRSFGFGKAPAGADAPAIYFWGAVRGRQGLYASLDWFNSEPRLIISAPSQMLANVESVAGDPDRVGRIYVGTSCAGWVQIDVAV